MAPDHVSADPGFSDVKTQHQTIRREFAVRTQRILAVHPPHQRPTLGLYPWPAASASTCGHHADKRITVCGWTMIVASSSANTSRYK